MADYSTQNVSSSKALDTWNAVGEQFAQHPGGPQFMAEIASYAPRLLKGDISLSIEPVLGGGGVKSFNLNTQRVSSPSRS